MMYSRPGSHETLKHMEEGHKPIKGVHYGSLIAEPLTKEQLLQALATIQSSDANMDMLFQLDGYEDEAVEKCAAALYSDKLLEKLNAEMMPVYTADTNDDDEAVSVSVMRAEGFVGHGIELLPKIWPKPAVRVGSFFDGGGGCGPYTNDCELCTYIDIDGGVFVARCFSLFSGTDVLVLEARVLVDGSDEFSLDGIQDMFPEEFHGFWDR